MSKQYGFMIWKMNVVYEFVNALKSIVLAKPIINIEIHGYGIQDLGRVSTFTVLIQPKLCPANLNKTPT